MKQRYTLPLLYNNNGISISLEYNATGFTFATSGPSTARPGGSVTKRIPITDTEVVKWCEAIWDAPDPVDSSSTVEELEDRLLAKENELQDLRGKLVVQQGNYESIANLKGKIHDLEYLLDKSQKELAAATKKKRW